jgi:crotonobetaine/carnitine-CoA ligase
LRSIRPLERYVLILCELLEQAASRFGSRPFLLTSVGEVSYLEGLARVSGAARLLADCGIRRGDRVAVVLPSSPEMAYAWFALGHLGAVLVPLNTALLPAETEPLLRAADARALIADAEHLPTYRSLLPWSVVLGVGDIGTAPGVLPFTAPPEANAPPCAARPDDLLAILQTSGTTSRAKGVCLSHRGYTWPAREFVSWMRVVPEDRFLSCLPLFHMAGQAFLASAVAGGAAVAFAPRFSAHHFWEQVREHRITLTRHLGEMLAVLCRLPESPEDRRHTLRAVYGGGARADVAAEFERRFGALVVEGYGLSETNTVLRNEIWDRRPGSIGRPLPHCEVRIADPLGHPLPATVAGGEPQVGEIQVRRNPVMMTGYIGGSGEDCFVDGWLRTGDLGYHDPRGDFYFVGRSKDTIRRRGENIHPAAIESVLDRHEALAASAVVGVPDELGGEEVKAFVVAKPGRSIDLAELGEWCRGFLAEFEIPRYFELCSALPRTETNKVNKGELRRRGNLGGAVFDRRVLVPREQDGR